MAKTTARKLYCNDCGASEVVPWFASYEPYIRCACGGWFNSEDVDTGAELIGKERQRQIESEGWSLRHDDAHGEGELRTAALCYLRSVGSVDRTNLKTGIPYDWPWDPSWWKPSDDPVATLVKAGALIAAEIDRIERARAKATTHA